MGEATPAQPAAGGFVPMLGVGMVGSMPGGGVTGPLSSSRVERLRARIELCRRHHSTCENRYQRGQAENSDREHESTLHLLNIVHQGPGNRKTKGTRASNQQPPDYSRVNGEQKGQSSSEGDQKISTRIALHGSLRRKIEGHIPGYSKQNGLSCGPPGPDYKRVRLEGGVGGLGGHGPCSFTSGQSQSLGGGALSMSHALNRKGNSSYMLPQGVVNSDLFNMTLKEMKKEPIEHVTSCGQTSTEMMVFDFKDEVGGGQIDPELQDLFDELTKSVPSLNDLEFEKMMKQDDTFGLTDLERSAATLCSHLEKPIKTEFSSPDFGQSLGGPPQLRPASAGPSFSTSSSSPINIQKGLSQGPSGPAGPPSRGLPGWPEMSHAEQLKQMAANQNQNPQTPLHHHQHPHQQSGGGGGPGASWNPHPSSRSYPQDKLSNSGSQGQRMANPQTSIGSQSKGINNCLFKPNGQNGSNQLDMKVVSNKPMLHFSPKTPQPHPNVASAQQQPPSTPTQNMAQSHPVHHYQNQQQQLPISGSPHMQPKTLAQRTPPLSQPGANHGPGPGLHFKLAQQRQVKITDKGNSQDQFNRHLTRPPPDYQQPCGLAQQTSLFTGRLTSLGQQGGGRPSQGPGQSLGDIMGWPPGAKPSTMGPGPGPLGVRRLSSSLQTQGGQSQSPLHMANHQYPLGPRQMGPGPPNQVAPDVGMLPLNPALRGSTSTTRSSQTMMPQLPGLTGHSQASQDQMLPAGGSGAGVFPPHNPGGSYQNQNSRAVNRLTFDFLQEGDNTVPGINTDSDFIDSLLKSGSGNDDWMKDINLDEILGGHS
uniref:Neurogenic mastermind-like N-terminal domain-containing protein n=1 Tax=Esox lucius TaxID=8010 RepID=A0A6Q2WZN1_ESOLU